MSVIILDYCVNLPDPRNPEFGKGNTFQLYIFKSDSRSKVRFLLPVQQPGSYWDRTLALSLVGLEPHTEVTACD